MSVNRWPRRVQKGAVFFCAGVVGIALGWIISDLVTLIARLWMSLS